MLNAMLAMIETLSEVQSCADPCEGGCFGMLEGYNGTRRCIPCREYIFFLNAFDYLCNDGIEHAQAYLIIDMLPPATMRTLSNLHEAREGFSR